MGRYWRISLLLTLALLWRAEGGDTATPDKAGPGEAGAAVSTPAWEMPEKERKRLRDALYDYLRPGKKTRQEMLEPLTKFIEKEIDGHSPFADVAAWVEAAVHTRDVNPKAGRKGAIKEVEVPPEVHGFPGGVGTVKYFVYLPKDYNEKQNYPLLFCLQDTKTWPDPDKYIEEQWVKPSGKIAAEFIVAAPVPAAKGDAWTKATAYARAMISLRHAMGGFEMDRKDAGPATDMRRVFVAGDDVAALAAARFGEMFCGAILIHCDGRASSGPDLTKVGGISGVPAYVVCDAKKKNHREFADRIKSANDASAIVESLVAEDAATWMAARPPVGPANHLEYAVHDSSFQRHHWITILAFDAASATGTPKVMATADRVANRIRVEVSGVTRFELFVNDAMVDLSKPVAVVIAEGGKDYEFLSEIPARDLGTLLEELVASNHPWRIYPVKLVVDLPKLRERQPAAG